MSDVRRRCPYAQVPEWLLRSEISSHAKVLWAALDRYAGLPHGAVPSRQTLAGEWLHASTDTVDRARAELLEVGALTVEDRPGTTSVYWLEDQQTLGTGAHTTLRTDADTPSAPVRNERKEVRESKLKDPPVSPPGTGLVANKRPVTSPELHLAQHVLEAFNDATGSNPPFRSDDWIRKIVLRCREHPELLLADHVLIMNRTLANPWWDGPASPAVIYGNGACFEQAAVARNGNGRPKRRYGTGMTATEIGQLGAKLREVGR